MHFVTSVLIEMFFLRAIVTYFPPGCYYWVLPYLHSLCMDIITINILLCFFYVTVQDFIGDTMNNTVPYIIEVATNRPFH